MDLNEIAKEIRERIPEAWEVDQQTDKGNIYKLGNYTVARHENFYVFNCYTQYRYGKNHEDGDEMPVDYEAITLCLRKINHIKRKN